MTDLYTNRPSHEEADLNDEDALTAQLSELGMHTTSAAGDDEDEEEEAEETPVEAVPAIEVEGEDPLLVEEEKKKRDLDEPLDELEALDEMAEEYQKDDSLIMGTEEEM